MVLAHLRELVAATDLPVNADFENGFGTYAATVAEEGRFDGIAGAASGQELNERFGKDAARRG